MLKQWTLAVAATAMLSIIWPGAAMAAKKPSGLPPDLGARAAILVNARTGAILYEKNAFRQMDPASLTKMMTALLVIEHGDLNRVVTVSKRADYTTGSSLHIGQGQQYTRLDLLKGLLLRSGNDASVALAESEAGSVERFVAEMNVKAQQLGAFNTSFENTHGLTRPGHYSSAYDLSLIARTALRMPLFQEIVKSQEQQITELTRHRKRTINTTNQLLYGFPGADGVKTGTTSAAGKCLVASATRDNRQLIAVVLNSPDRWQDASSLLNWGFAAWSPVKAVSAGEGLIQRPVSSGNPSTTTLVAHRSIWVDLPANGSYETSMDVPERLEAPLSPRQRAGFVTVTPPAQPPIRIGLYPVQAVRKKLAPARFWDWLFYRHPR